MIIQSSAVGMAANTVQRTRYTENNESLIMNMGNGSIGHSAGSFEDSYERAYSERTYQENSQNSQLSDKDAATKQSGERIRGNDHVQADAAQQIVPGYARGIRMSGIGTDAAGNMVLQLRNYLFNFRNKLSMMSRRSLYGGLGVFGRGLSFYPYAYGNQTLNLSSGTGNASVWRRLESHSYTYQEQESMTFETVGKALTADGRTIEFNMELEMSREYTETVACLEDTTVIMTDPLVINLDSNPVSVSDEKWKFDIDGDGKTDNISKLSEGAGYLVLDKNKDGVINNGTEMFGAKTGNGFAELADYDEDGNGWIDENDAVYKDLAVWIKDDKGNDKLVSLKDANVGAIYLGSAATEFALKSEQDNTYNAQIRRTGVYLTEDGKANTIQQLDLVNALIS